MDYGKVNAAGLAVGPVGGDLAVFYHFGYFQPCPGYGFSCSSITGVYSGGGSVCSSLSHKCSLFGESYEWLGDIRYAEL